MIDMVLYIDTCPKFNHLYCCYWIGPMLTNLLMNKANPVSDPQYRGDRVGQLYDEAHDYDLNVKHLH